MACLRSVDRDIFQEVQSSNSDRNWPKSRRILVHTRRAERQSRAEQKWPWEKTSFSVLSRNLLEIVKNVPEVASKCCELIAEMSTVHMAVLEDANDLRSSLIEANKKKPTYAEATKPIVGRVSIQPSKPRRLKLHCTFIFSRHIY